LRHQSLTCGKSDLTVLQNICLAELQVQQAVETFGWLRPEEMIDGLGLAETTPEPLILSGALAAVTAAVGVILNLTIWFALSRAVQISGAHILRPRAGFPQSRLARADAFRDRRCWPVHLSFRVFCERSCCVLRWA
jgi:hypothetical protein